MKFSKVLLMAVGLTVALALNAFAQTADLRFVFVNTDVTNYDVRVQIRASSAFKIGTSNLFFEFSNTSLGNPSVLSAFNFSGGGYQAIVLGPVSANFPNAGVNTVSVNIELNTAGTGSTVPTSYIDVATLRFPITKKSGSSNLKWHPSGGGVGSIYVQTDAENGTTVSTDTLGNLNTNPLPIQLSSLTVGLLSASEVKLSWTTLTETNNFGFEVQKSATATGSFETIPNSFVKGQGTSTQSHSYSYTATDAASGDWYYRLKQTDLDGTPHYSDAVKPTVVTGVAEKPMPKAFALDQNYPNPFNPSTNIDFALPKDSHVKIEVYNIIGQRVATLVDEVRPVGYYTVSFNATNLASGIYFYRLTTNEASFLKKMMLLK